MSTESNTPAPQDGEPTTSSPYRNLWVPLVLVPALIVVVLVLVFLAFGGIVGSESTIRSDLNTAVHGGANERTQAIFKLTQKMHENRQAVELGEPEPWETGPDLLPKLRQAWEQLDETDYQIRYVVAALLLLEGESDAGVYMGEFLELGEAEDPEGVLRRNALMSLALAGDPQALSEALELAEHDDKASRIHAMILLSKLDGDQADAALVTGLSDGELEVRANAAIALAGKSDARGADVLIALIDPATIAAERERDPKRFAAEDAPRNVRMTAVAMLGSLGRPEDVALLRSLASGDEDLEVRRVASEALGAGQVPIQD
jgi:HEAT repeat protein